MSAELFKIKICNLVTNIDALQIYNLEMSNEEQQESINIIKTLLLDLKKMKKIRLQ